MRILLVSVCLLLPATCFARPVAAPRRVPPSEAVVKITASIRYPDLIRPWTRPRSTEVSGTGVVLFGRKVLTNAHVVHYASEIHVQTGPGGDKFEAKVESIAPEVDLAVLTVADKTLFTKRFPLARAAKRPATRETVEVYGFPIGGAEMSVTKGVISRIGYGAYPGMTGLVIQVSAAINPGNSGGPATVGGKMVGLVFSRLSAGENIGYVIPNEEIDLFLEDVKDGRYDGKPDDATLTHYQRLKNDDLRAMLKLDKKTRGILAIPPRTGDPGNPFREFDVITKIGPHEIDNDGMVYLQDGLRVPFNGMIPSLARNNAVPLSVLRQGKPLTVSLPVTTKDRRVIRELRGEQPSWFIYGPLAFAPARSDAISAIYGVHPEVLRRRSPLLRRAGDRMRFPEEELVIVTHPMFEHKLAKGYNDPFGQVLTEVNGKKIKNLRHLVEVLRDCTDEFLKFRFAEEGSEILVFRRKEMSKATEEIMEDAGIAPTKRGSRDMLKVWNNGSPARDE
jgi:S1-C subfamily serine protease